MKTMYYWLKGTTHKFLVFLGLHLDDEWILLRAIRAEYGSQAAENCFARAICLSIKHGRSWRAAKRIREETE